RVANRSFWLVTAGTATTIVMPTLAGVHCRHRNGVEPCTGNYGSFWAIEGVRIGFSTLIFPMTYALKKDDEGNPHGKWWLPAAAFSAFNIGYAMRQYNQGCEGKPRDPKTGKCD